MARPQHSTTDQYREPMQDNVHSHSKQKECNDVFFLLLFLAFLIMTLVFALQYGTEFVDVTTIKETTNSAGFGVIMEYLAYAGLVSVGLSLGMVIIMIVAGECLIWTALILIIVINIVIAIVFTKVLYDEKHDIYWWPAVVFGVMALLTALYAFFVRNRIQFAAKHLKVAGSAIMSLPMMIIVAFVMVFVQFGWALVWFLGNAGILFKGGYITVPTQCVEDDCKIETELGKAVGITFGMLFVFFWVAFVIKNIVNVTVAGSVASWKIKSGAPMITIRSWVRALTLSLGSICFGSLIVAILETIKQFINALQYAAGKSGNCVASCLLGCLSCLIGCIESAVKIFNRYAYAYVGVYGYSFMTAGRHVCTLFSTKGWSAIVNDNLVGNVFFLANILVAGLTAFIAVDWVDRADSDTFANISHPETVIGVLAFVMAYAICSIFMSVFEGAVTTVFVLWSEDPQGWQLTHPDHYASLHAAWLKMYPREYNDGHGEKPAAGRHPV